MLRALDPFRFLLIAVAGWMNQHQLLVIDYLREENRILREQLGGRQLRFTNRENGELDRLREANDLNRDGSVRYPARGVSKRRKRQNPKYCRMLGIQPREKNTIWSRSTGRAALQFWKLAPQDEQNTYRSPGEIAEGRFLCCKQTGYST